MRCSHVQSQLSAYADGELNAVHSQRVAAHVAGCAECAGEYEMLRSVISLAALVPEEESPTGLRERILTAARSLEHQPQPSMWQQVRAWAMPPRPVWASAFAASIALVGVASVWRPTEKIVASTVPPPHQPAPVDNAAKPAAPVDGRQEVVTPNTPVAAAKVACPEREVKQPAPVADAEPEAPVKPSPAAGPETRPAVHAARPKHAPATLSPSGLSTGLVAEPKLSQPPTPVLPDETPGTTPVMANVTPVPGVPGPEPLVNENKPGKMMVSAPSGPEEGTEDEDILLKLKRELRDRNLMVPQPPTEEISKPGRRMRG